MSRYQDARREWLKAKAIEDYRTAAQQVEEMIDSCDCEEALPFLEAERVRLWAHKAKHERSQTWWGRFLNYMGAA